VRLVDGVPERGPASNSGVDVFRVGGPRTGHEGPHLLVKTPSGEMNGAPA